MLSNSTRLPNSVHKFLGSVQFGWLGTTISPIMELKTQQGRKYQGPNNKRKTQTAMFWKCEVGKLSRRLGTCVGS